MSLKHNLRDVMRAQSLSLTDLARFSGVPKQTLNDWLAGTSPRNLRQLKAVADVLRVSIDSLVCGSEKPAALPFEMLDGARWTHGIFEIRFRRIKGK